LKIGFDLHGVLTESPHVLKPILKMLATDNEINIISGSELIYMEKELTEMGYVEGTHYHRVFSMVDYMKQNGYDMWTEWNEKEQRETWWCEDYIWWMIKGEICDKLDIDVLFDDKIEYEEYMPSFTKFYLIGGDIND